MTDTLQIHKEKPKATLFYGLRLTAKPSDRHASSNPINLSSPLKGDVQEKKVVVAKLLKQPRREDVQVLDPSKRVKVSKLQMT